MSKKRVLIYPCGTEIALEMWESLRYSKHFEPIGLNDIPSAWPGRTISNSNQLSDMDMVMAAHDRVDIEVGRVVSHPRDTALVCRSKKATYSLFPDISPEQITTFPAFVKPDKGSGSRGAMLCENRTQFEANEQKYGTLVQMEALKGPETTVDCFTDRHGNLLFERSRGRKHTSNGISVHCTEAEGPMFGHMINAELKFRGAWFYQTKGGKLLEIGARIAGSSGFLRAHGVNLVEATLFDALDIDVKFPQVPPSGFETFRRLSTRLTGLEFDTVYVDYDDTIMVDGKPLPELVGLLYKWHNEGKKIVIVSRNVQEDPAFFLLDLQPDYIHCPRPEPKSQHIKLGGIFIDDSFTEREEVRKNAGVPVFGLEALNMLW